MTTPDPQNEIYRKAERAGRWHSRLSTIQLWLMLAPVVVFLLVCVGCVGWQRAH